MNILAIDIGGTKFSLALFQDGKCLRRIAQPTNREGGREWMLASLVSLIHKWSSLGRIDFCGIGFGGPVDFLNQRIALSTHVGGWSDYDLPGFLLSECELASVMDNDANTGALGEGIYGAGKDYDPVFYMTLSTGIGGGILYKGEVSRGADSYAGEIGHLTVRPGGPECLCGSSGCLERLCCGLWLQRDYGCEASKLFADQQFVQRYVVDLALGLKSCIMLLNPARIVIGGGIAKAGDALFEPLRSELRLQIPHWSRARIDVVPAALGDDSVLWGAMVLASRAYQAQEGSNVR